jgi:biopolymer transport protein ExbB/TolQ
MLVFVSLVLVLLVFMILVMLVLVMISMLVARRVMREIWSEKRKLCSDVSTRKGISSVKTRV